MRPTGAAGRARRSARRGRSAPAATTTRPTTADTGPVTLTLVTYDSFACPKACSTSSRPTRASRSRSSAGRRRRRGREPGDAHQGQPAGDVLFGRRQHLPLPGARRGASSCPTSRPRSATSDDLTELDRRVTRSRRSTTATCASTTTSAGSTDEGSHRPRRSRSRRPRVQGTCSWSRTRRRRRPGWRSCSPPSPASAKTGGRTTGTSSARQRRRGRRRLEGGLLHEFSGGSGEGDRPARRVVRLEPAGRGRVRRPPRSRPSRRPAWSTDGCFRQVEFAGILAGTEHEDEARELIDFMLSPTRSRRTCRSTCSCSRCDASVAAARGLHQFVESCPTIRSRCPPDEIAANRERWIEEWTDQPSCGDRGCQVARCGLRWRRPVAFLAVFFVWPVAAIIGRGHSTASGWSATCSPTTGLRRSRGSRSGRRRPSTALTLAVGAARWPTCSRGSASAAGASCGPSSPCRSCCRPSWSAPRSSRLPARRARHDTRAGRS